jgi:methylglyoxal synthase
MRADTSTLGIALIAHDRMKPALADWAAKHAGRLGRHRLFATGTTGGTVLDRVPDLAIRRVKSGPLGGDLQIGARLADGEIDVVVFFVDALTPQPHDVDVKALIRIATLYDVPMAVSPATADALMTAPWIDDPTQLPARTEP